MLDLLSPLRGYIAQNLQFYLSKYIKDIQLEGLGLFGGDLVLNDLEIKRHVLRESLEIPPSFDFSRGFIRELRIHIPWTQLLSQPIEVKLYTIELILTAKSDAEQRSARASSHDTAHKTGETPEDKIEQPKSGWIHDTLQKILANISVQVNNLVLKYEHDDVVFSIALGTLDFYSASENEGWKRSFEELKGGRRAICKRIDAKDVTIFLDRYTSDGDTKDRMTQDPVRRKVIGYEVPVLSRTSASVRAKLQLFTNATVNAQNGRGNKANSPQSPLHRQSVAANDDCDGGNIIDVDGLFAYRPSVLCDPFYYYSCNRSRVMPMYEVDIFIGELLFSVSDRQLEMLNQLIKSASRKIDQAHAVSSQRRNRDLHAKPDRVSNIPVVVPQKEQTERQKMGSSATKQESWFGWAMNALGTVEDEDEDELVSELLAETRGALLKGQPPVSNTDDNLFMSDGPVTKTSCVRVCIRSASLTLRKHDKEEQVENEESTIAESKEEFVPVANLGMVKVSLQTRKRKVARPPVPILHLTLSYVALELLLARGEEKSGTDLVFEIEMVELVSDTTSNSREDSKYNKGNVLLSWGSIDSSHFSACVSHPYFINSFFGEETTRLNQRDSRSFEIVKVSLDADIPVWKTLEINSGRNNSNENSNSVCACFTTWNGKSVRCIPIATISGICQQTIRAIGIKERVLDGGILSNAVSTAWASSGFPISISEVMSRAIASAAEEYRANRNPDLGAPENLAQLLQPQLTALFSRYTLHSCSAALLKPSSFSSSTIRHRSVHSALRMRLSSTSTFTNFGESEVPVKKETVSKVLDISLGAVRAVLEPPICLEVIEALSIIAGKNEDDANKSVVERSELSASATQEMEPSNQSVMQSDTTLATANSVHIRLPNLHENSGQNAVGTRFSGCLGVVVNDFAWLGTFHPGNNKSRLQISVLTAHLERSQTECTLLPLVEALGVELLATGNSADASDNDEIFANFNKLKIDLSLYAAQNVAALVNGLSSPIGYPIAWEPMNLAAKTLQTSFEIEVCGATFSRIVSNKPRLVMAHYQTLKAEVGSASISLASATSKTKGSGPILQGGAAPMTTQEMEVNTPLFKTEISQEKSSGILNAVPLLGSLNLFSLNPGLLSTTSTHCQLSVEAQLARVYIELQGLSHLSDAVLRLVSGITANLVVKKELTPALGGPDNGDQRMNPTSSAPTGWVFTFDLKAAGGEVHVNEALELKLPLLSISSMEADTGPAHQAIPGGELKLVFAMKGASITISESGVLKGLGDPMILDLQDVEASGNFLHRFLGNYHAYSVDASIHVSGIQVSLSRLKLLYLTKKTFLKSKAQQKSFQASQPGLAEKDKVGSGTELRSRWYWRLGAQVDHVGFSCTADINHLSRHQTRQIRAVVDGKVANVGVAIRNGNHHPTKNHLQPTGCGGFTDIQVSVGNIQVVERLQNARRDIRTGFGEFSRLPEHAFLGILVCVDMPDLKSLSDAFFVLNTNISDQQTLPSAMLSWHLTSSIAKAFQEASTKWHRREAEKKQPTAEIPLVVTWNDSAKTTHSFPLFSGFYRNYNEAGLPHHVIAGSMESVDVAVTTSSLYCLASVLQVRGRESQKPFSRLSDTTKAIKTDDPTNAEPSLDGTSSRSLSGVEISLLLGQVRLILPNESLMDSILSRQSIVDGNVVIVLESLSIASAMRNNISLDGLGYPPFNSRVLPRRPNIHAQRFGQSQLRIGCRAGNISGFVAGLEFNKVAPASSMFEATGPFEEYVGCVAGYSARFFNAETFWSPLNVACTVEEEPHVSNNGKPGVKTTASIVLTKVRLDLHKPSFDVLVTRVAGMALGIGVLRRSVAKPARVKMIPVQLSKPQKPTSFLDGANQREISISCDGIEVNAFEMNRSTHIRVGSIVLAHNFSVLSGSVSVQNLVVGHRPNEKPNSLTQETTVIEEVIFGANVEPSLWQMAVENYPEKLIAGRWNFSDRAEGTLFLDVQAYQLHVSHHFLLASAQFTHTKSEFSFSELHQELRMNEIVDPPMECKPFVFQQRWNIKVLVAPSVVSYWRQNPTKRGRSGVWITSGQLFVSVGVGSDEMAQQALCTYGYVVNEINRFVAVPTLEMMLNLDKFGINTSDDLPSLEVQFQRNSVGLVQSHTSSTWQQFSKYISVVSEAQRVVYDCSIRITGEQHQMLERAKVGETGVCILCTDLARTSIQAEVNALCVKLSPFSLGAMKSLLAVRVEGNKQFSGEDSPTSDIVIQRRTGYENFGLSTDDFKNLRRMAEGRRPSPGELVLTEALLIETQSIISSSSSPVVGAKVHIHIDPNKFNIDLADVTAYLGDCNESWGVEAHGTNGERTSYTNLGNKTHSWMGMRWCYHIPRKICKIVANPVPVPPTGIPSGWPSWSWNQHEESDAGRVCDIFCQLRCWDSKKACFVVICEFYVPWERPSTNSGSDGMEDTDEPGSFGELMSQWFDDDMEKTRYRAKLLEFAAQRRTIFFDNEQPSDNWELRWRSPLQSEQESENKQKRLVVNALLASSLQVHSFVACSAYQRVVSSVILPQATLSISHVGSENDSHDMITAEINDTVLSCAICGDTRARTLNVRASSALQVYLDNMVQLLTVSVIPRTTIDAMVDASEKGLEVSTLIGPTSVYLNQTSILVVSAIPKLLQADPEEFQVITTTSDEKLSSMRITIINYSGMDIWYGQEGTSECLLLAADASAAYSWLSLANNPFYQLRFAVDDPHHKPTEGLTSDKMQTDSDESVQEDPCWSDPCRIKDNSVTARYFGGHGFLWVCVELRGLQTVVTLRSSLTVRNYCDFPVRIQVNKQDFEHSCARSDSLYKDTPIMQKISHHHPNCISLDGSACAVTTYAKVEHNVSRVMVESVSTIDFGIHGGPWCSAPTQGHVPKEFDLVKISDNEADGSKKAKCNFATLRPQHSSEVTHYVWSKVARSQCRTVLPTDFDPLQPHVSRRYTWMEMTLWPAVTVENIMDIPLTLSLSQKATAVNLKISPSSEQSLSVINPFEPMSIQLHYDQCSSSEQSSLKSQEFLLECTTPEDSKQQIFVFEGCRVVAGFCHDHRPMIRIRTERILSVANMTSSALNIKIGTPLGNKRALERIDSCVERSVCFSMISNRLVISIATFKDSNHETDQFEWSPEISMNVKGETKPIIVPSGRPELRSLLSAYCVDLINSDGYLRLIIRPQVVVVNSTNCDLKCVATDGRGNALVGDDEASLISGNNGGWSVPVCLHKEAKKRSITADVSSWLSSRLSRRPSEDLTNAPKQPLVAKLSCSFRVTLEEDGYEWTEEIAVLLPKIPLQFNPDGKLTSVEPPTSSSTPTTTQDGLYPAPSTTTHRRRLLIRHRDFKHKMLTYTMTQKGKSIHIMFFVDHQAPVVIHNQWQNMLGFRNVSFPSDPEGVGANFYLEYDWGLQVSAKQHRSIPEEGFGIDDTEHDSERKLLSDWLAASSQSLENVDIAATTTNERMRFQIGSPEYGWSNTLWQVGGIQFASFASATDKPSPTFLVMCYFRAGSWLLSITCLEDPTRGQLNLKPSLVLPSMASPVKTKQTAPSFLRVGVVVEELSFHFCDEHDPVRDARGMILYPEILRATCSAVSIVFATAPDPPEVSRHSTHLGYLSHIRSYTTLFVTMEDIEVGHFLQTCNFPVILCFPETHTSKDLLNFDRVKKHARLGILMGKLLDKQLPGAENASLITRVIYTDTWDPTGIPSYFHSIELKLAPAVLQVEDDILLYMNAYMRPIVDALEGEAAGRVPLVSSEDHCLTSSWSLHAYESVTVTKQRKVYIEHLGISNLQVTITARVSIPVLNSFDGTPLHFGATEMCEVFSFPDQLYKDLAADYVADTIVRSPMLLMSLNIIGNPAGFLRSFGQGVRDLVEIPLAASRNGYSPWVLTKGVVGGVASFFGHATAATLTSVSGFSYSFSRTMDQLTLPSDELRKRHYTRPTQLSSALADGLGSLGSSVVGAAAGVITTPIAVYKERQMQGLETGLRNVVGGVGMGLVGIVARPMGGVASLVSMASDGLLYGLGGSRTPFDDSVSRFDARPNELLRYKLKVLPDAIGSSLIFAHGVWVVPDENKLLVFEQDLDYISKEQLEASENEPIRSLLLPGDTTHRLIQVTVVCSNECVYVVGVSGAQNQAVLARTPLESIEAIEESLKEATVFDLGIKTLASAEWLRFRLSPGQRRHLSHQLRLRLAEESSCLVVHPLALENLEKGERLRRIDAVLNLRSRVKKMEVNERAKAEGVESKSSDGVNIFRLMKLMRETQCEMEVVKPVLDELEVMRLCRSFGMMSSVNPKDFNFDVLHAREFDDDFIRFLRFELFERSCPGDVAVKGLFGRQDQVADALVGMRACSTETVATLAASDEGMYCVKLNTECREVQDNEDEKSGSLVVFSWIRDELFEPQGLRDTPAFVLRFLTGLTSDIVCCTSALDLELIKTATTASDEQEDDELSSYSVSFHIEKQEDQSDSTKCVAVSSVDLDTLPENYSNICLLKGAYPAIAVTGAVNSAIRIESRRRTFQTGMQVSFAAWLKAESERYRIDLSPTIVRSPKLCKNILKEFDMWPEEQMKASRDAYEKKQQEEFKKAVILLENEIVNQREKIDRVSDELFRLHSTRTPEVESDSSFQEAMTIYEEFQEWLTSVCSWKLDRKFRLVMDSPTRLREIVAGLYGLYSRGHKEVLSKLLGMCVSTSKTELLQAMNKCRGRTDKKQSSGTDKAEHDNTQVTMWEKFLDEIAEPLEALRTKWWIAVQSGLAVAKDVSLESLKSEQKHAKTVWYDNEKLIIESNFDQLRKRLTSKDGLTLSVSAQTRGRGIVHCDASREVLAPPTRYLDIMKLDVQGGKEYLGRLLLEPNKSHVAMFTVKVRSAVQICTGTERMCAKFIHFPTVTDPSRPPRASAKVIRTFGQFASVCDYDARNRIMTFLSKDSVGIYKFDESFKNMELMKRVDLGVRSTLTELPFTDVLLVGSIIYVTDSSGDSQAIDIHNDQTSNVVSVPDGAEVDVTSSRLLELADNLAIGVVSFVPSDDGAFDGALESISCDDYRHLPVLPLGMKFLTDRVSVQCFDDRVLVLDPLVQKVYMLSIQVTVRSDSYRMRQSDNGEAKSCEASNADCPRKQHWIYTFYHVFEKFPVRGFLDSGSPPLTSVLIACPGVGNISAALEIYHDFLSLLMSDLMALNKPLHGLDLTKGLAVQCSLYGVGMKLKPSKSFFQTLITFLPIQICRAEGNALTVLDDGMDQSLGDQGDELQTWGAADIAESIRFGLLSPLLCSWRGRCVVITSMGKQSTGKSYFLNHLTGASFAIAGNRCTDGAWMTLRIMGDVLLVVLDFEGLGSFERTDQEDVFLSVLNASLSMFTIFRMEMRFDKDIDGLFTKFQKGINLLKNDERLFQGTLYMSVKDVNPNDRHGVLSEFQSKFQKLLTANRENNFLTEMYSGKLGINCSPPLGTHGYYDSVRHARQLIEKLVNEPDSSRGFKNGSAFHDCIRLVLAKISILDWTAVDESSQRLEMNELYRKLPGAIRTGCLIPVDTQSRAENLPRSLKDPLLHNESVLCMLKLEQLCLDYPELSESWTSVAQEVSLDAMDDEDIDFGPSVCFHANASTGPVHSTLLNLFQRYLALTAKGPLEKIMDQDYASFDAMLSFIVCRRKTKVALWVKQFLGTERFLDEWEQIEQTYILPFEALFKRCLHACTQCQLQCMQSVCHSFDEEHDCGMSHTCRGLCEYCMLKYQPGKEMPQCVGKAGHEGKCDCAKGDHTCGVECSLVNASNCGGICVLIGGHDGDHRCSVKQHACGAACSAATCCGKCILNMEHAHTVHKCAEMQCKHSCEMDSCKERCSAGNHFHGQPTLGKKFAEENGRSPEYDSAQVAQTADIFHLCNSRHACNATCEAEGICTKSVQVSTSKFSGSCDTFDFELKQMIGVRNKCTIVLQSGKTNHDGAAHSCVKLLPNGTKTVHGCGVRCAACEYYCDKPVGHEGDHSAAHGNMRNMHFVAEDSVIHWENHKYAVGEKGVAEMCNMHCSSAGRGHVHYLKCDKATASTCVYTGLQDQRRHCTSELKPRPGHEVDELLHDKYWKTIGWEDPCRSAVERALFAKCPYKCDAPEHNGKCKLPSNCDLDVWHAPVTTPPVTERKGFSYVSGHRFACSHTSSTGNVHHVFVLDCSGSMRGEPWRELLRGVREYLRSRLVNGATGDIVSVVTFGNRGIIEYERVGINIAPSQRIDFRGGGTFYTNGLSQAIAIFSRTNLSAYKPVMIFFTDGRPADRKKGPAMAVEVRERYAKFGLCTFVVGYGRASDIGLADLAEKLGGSVHEALTTADLGEAFRSISMSLGARAGLIHSTATA